MKLDVSIVTFLLVLLIAVPVTALRSQTYSVGYEIAALKKSERDLIEKNLHLRAELELLQAQLYRDQTGENSLFYANNKSSYAPHESP